MLQEAIEKSATPAADLRGLAKVERELLPDEPILSLTRADAVKSSLQNEAQRGYRQMATGGRLSETPMKARVAVANKAREAVEQAAPAVGPLNKQYARLKGESTALRDALKREGNTLSIGGAKDLAGLAMGGGAYYASQDPETAAILGVLTRLLATPRTGSLAALLMDRTGRGAQVAHPQMMRAAMLAQHGQED